MTRTSLIFLAPLILSIGFSGCSQPQTDPANEVPIASEGENGGEGWFLKNSTFIGYLVGTGTFFDTGGLRSPDHCTEFTFEVPSNATRLEVRLEGALLNTTEGRAGQYVLIVNAPDGEQLQRNRFSHQNQTIWVDEPLKGTWEVVVTPSPAVINQYWPVYVTLSGQGSSPENLDFLFPDWCLGPWP